MRQHSIRARISVLVVDLDFIRVVTLWLQLGQNRVKVLDQRKGAFCGQY